jgi:thiamine biosynthesis lipoprotein
MSAPERSATSHPNRRQIILLGIGAFAVATVPFARRWRRKLIRRSVPVMGTLADIAVVHKDEVYAHHAIDAAIAELRFVDRTMSRFSTTSDVGRANLTVGTEPVDITPETALVLREALRWAESSDGAFDPCIGKAVTLWDVANRKAPPPDSRVSRFANRQLYRSLDVATQRGRQVMRFSDEDVAIDLGGIAKGYGVDRAVDALRSWGIERGLVNVGGDLYALGASADGDPWKIGVRSPNDPSQLAGTLKVTDGAVATSGDYLQFFRHQGTQYHHLLDPATGAPRRAATHSVTVAANDCMTADAAATTAFGMQPGDADDLLRRRSPDARIVHTRLTT